MSPHQHNGVHEQLLQREQQLMDPAFRKNSAAVANLLADDFREYGASGREWSREAILAELAHEPAYTTPAILDFVVRIIALGTALVTYRTERSGTPAAGKPAQTLRSSLWIQTSEGWQLLFHQGTPIPLDLSS